MDDNPQTSTTETPPAAAAAPMTPPTAAPGVMPATAYASGQAGTASQDERSQAMLMWILAIFTYWIAPLIFYLIAKDKPFVYRQSAQALAFTLANVVVMIVMSVTVILIPLAFLVMLYNLIICIMGAVAANKGEEYTPPITAGLARSMFKA